MTTQTFPSISPEMRASMEKAGLMEEFNKQIAQVEQELGINLRKIDEALNVFVTVDPDCLELKRQTRILATHEDSVLIQGETGTGKEIIASVLGANRKSGLYVAINVAAIPYDLVESTLFGSTKGSFTGAVDKQGLIQYAGAGTLFLDEIGDLSLDMQAKFLRVIQEMKVRRIGAQEEEAVKCRFIAASHLDLKELVARKLFRLDLYARLSTFILTIPPLRNRLCDIPTICKMLDHKFPADQINWSKVDLSLNVRSLQQYCRRWLLLQQLPTQQ